MFSFHINTVYIIQCQASRQKKDRKQVCCWQCVSVADYRAVWPRGVRKGGDSANHSSTVGKTTHRVNRCVLNVLNGIWHQDHIGML